MECHLVGKETRRLGGMRKYEQRQRLASKKCDAERTEERQEDREMQRQEKVQVEKTKEKLGV